MSENNPYQQPKAELLEGVEQASFGAITQSRRTPFGHGATWLADAWRMFTLNWGLWLAGVLVVMLIAMAIGFIPLIGTLAGPLMNPVLYAGIFIVARKMDAGQSVDFGDFFYGFQNRTGTLIGFGAINLLLAIVFMVVIGVLAWAILGSDFSAMMSAVDADSVPQANPQFALNLALVGLIALAVMVPWMALIWFAVPLLVLDDSMTIGRAMSLSFSGCLKNILPMFLYGLLATVLVVAALIPLMLGLLVVMPLMFISLYTSLKDIYVQAA